MIRYSLAAALVGVMALSWYAIRQTNSNASLRLSVAALEADLSARKVELEFYRSATQRMQEFNHALAASNARLETVRDWIRRNDNEILIDPLLRGTLDRLRCARDPNCNPDSDSGGPG